MCNLFFNIFTPKRYKPEAIKKYQGKETDPPVLITYKELTKIKVGEEFTVQNDKKNVASCKRLTNTKDGSLVFVVDIKAKGVWINHKHDCIETIIVFDGEIVDRVSNTKLTRQEAMKIPPKQHHLICAIKDSTFYVQFKKPSF